MRGDLPLPSAGGACEQPGGGVSQKCWSEISLGTFESHGRVGHGATAPAGTTTLRKGDPISPRSTADHRNRMDKGDFAFPRFRYQGQTPERIGLHDSLRDGQPYALVPLGFGSSAASDGLTA